MGSSLVPRHCAPYGPLWCRQCRVPADILRCARVAFFTSSYVGAPHTFLFLQVLLTSLLHLKLDGNNMPHLAVPPLLKTPNGKDLSTNWAKRWDRDKKREVRLNCPLSALCYTTFTVAPTFGMFLTPVHGQLYPSNLSRWPGTPVSLVVDF